MTSNDGHGSGKQDERVPEAVMDGVARQGAPSPVWLVPVAVLVVVAVIGWRAWQDRAVHVEVSFDAAHGLDAGDPVRASGMEVGIVKALSLDAGDGVPVVRATLALARPNIGLLREGVAFWIERPRVDFGGVGGLDTITGPRYVGLRPGTGAPTLGPFVGLAEVPVDDVAAGEGMTGLRLRLESEGRAGMRVGGTITYRGVEIGRILSVELARDATRVEAEVLVDSAHAPLIRENSRFFSTSGIGFELGFDGLRADVDSLESMVAGGIGVATPTRPGAPVESGAVFELAERAESNWLEWAPRIELTDRASE